MRSTFTRPVPTTAVVAAMGLSLTACGGGMDGMNMSDSPSATTPAASSSFGPAASGPHNDADVTFATDMIPHHAQAVEMATLALQKGTNAKVKELATAIQAAQTPEIKTLSGWLVGWGEPIPMTGSMGSMSSMGSMGSMGPMGSGTGMMTDAQMSELAAASGAAFDKLWVQMMTEHHRGAISMAQTELKDGQNAEVKALAQQIIDAQTREIATMTELAKTLA